MIQNIFCQHSDWHDLELFNCHIELYPRIILNRVYCQIFLKLCQFFYSIFSSICCGLAKANLNDSYGLKNHSDTRILIENQSHAIDIMGANFALRRVVHAKNF